MQEKNKQMRSVLHGEEKAKRRPVNSEWYSENIPVKVIHCFS